MNDAPTTPPFWGAQSIETTLDAVEPLLDREQLFAARWQFRQGAAAADWERTKEERCEPRLERLLAMSRAQQILQPVLRVGFFRCRRQENALLVEGRRIVRFDFPRERAAPNRCVADFFPDGFCALQIATVGDAVDLKAKECFEQQAFSDAFFLKGLAAQMAEAVAAFGHAHIREACGVAPECGERFSPGYPAFPDLFAQRGIVALLDAAAVGVALTETCQFLPEYTTSAIVSVDPSAARFRP